MAWTLSDQRRLRTWLAAVVAGGVIGYGYIFVIAPWTPMRVHGPMAVEALKGFRVGMLIAGLAVGFELYGMRTVIGDWLRRLSFVSAFVLREAMLIAMVVVSLVLNSLLSRWMQGDEPIFHYPLESLLIDAAFSFAVCGLVLFVIQMRHLIGPRTLTNILLGRYHRPIKELKRSACSFSSTCGSPPGLPPRSAMNGSTLCFPASLRMPTARSSITAARCIPMSATR